MMTERVYDLDSYIRSMEATVLACEERKGGWRIALDRTCFFPEGGGQFGDVGTLYPAEGVPLTVTDTREEGGAIWHQTDRPLPAGGNVRGEIDWEVRFSRMQCHTGEHIVSGLFHTLYGLENVGFHLGEEEITIDLSGPVTWADSENVPVVCAYPAPEELEHLEYRSKLDLKEHVRIVTISGYDRCACCAPHVGRTGEVGLIHLLSMQNWKGGVRLRMLCGSRAVEDVMRKQASVTALSNLLSAKQEEVAEAARRMSGELEQARLRAVRLGRALARAKAEILPQGAERVLVFEELDADALRALVNAALERGIGLCAAFAPEEGGFRDILGAAGRDLRPLVREMNAALRGRGGGSAGMVQGSVTASREAVEAWWDKCE